jgi:hypothetical protein
MAAMGATSSASADRDSNAAPSVVFLRGIGAAARAWNPPRFLNFLRHAPATT